MLLLFHLLCIISTVELIVHNYYDSVLVGNQTIQKILDDTAKTSKLKRKVSTIQYDVNSDYCHMPHVNAYSQQVLSLHVHPPKLRSCKGSQEIVTISWNTQKSRYQLNVNMQAASELIDVSAFTIKCHYRAIERDALESDKNIRLKKPVKFVDKQLVPAHIESILINCQISGKGSYTTRRVRIDDGVAFIQPKRKTLSKLDKNRIPSVLMLGIDSMSRSNLRRTLPKVSKYLNRSHWYELKGFNKVGDNTLPNILATLTGYGPKGASEAFCNVDNQTDANCFDKLPFIWKDFKFAGYITAQAEDSTEVGTFNHLRKGFHTPPVDHYLRPFLLALENELPKFQINGLNSCLGNRPGMKYILEYCVQFLERYLKSQPIFGLFWTNSFSSEGYTGPSGYDRFLYDYIRKFESLDLFKESIVILLSDHGMRYGNIINLSDGYLEERLPMVFISLPPWFQNTYPQFTKALEMNRNRLSSNYDLYLTLKHIALLQVSANPTIIPTHDCPKCQSLFYDLPKSRSCRDAGIKDHWCACETYDEVPISDMIQNMCHYIVTRINQLLVEHNVGQQCSPLRLSGILKAQRRRSQPHDSANVTLYRLRLEALPNKVIFEATMSHNEILNKYEMDMDMSRLSGFNRESSCMSVKKLKKFCVCQNQIRIN